MTIVHRLAEFACGLDLGAVPTEVRALTDAQTRSVLAACGASTSDPATQRVTGAIAATAADGPVPVPGLDRAIALDDGIRALSALSIALDFDDYLCFGHTGHSSVLVPNAMALAGEGDPAQVTAATVVANEIGARLGGSCLVGPLNGQLWSFIHAAGAAVAAGRMIGLDESRMAHAIAIALYQAPRPTVPGFMAPDTKLLTAADPTLTGVRAARLAAGGVTGPIDVLDHPQGFFSAFAHAALPAMLGGLGEGWATRTLCVKPTPGCAYVDTTLDALAEIGPIDPDAVESVEVSAGLLTTQMDELSGPYADVDPPSPVTINFSIRWNVAVAIVAGSVSPDVVNEKWLADHAAALRRIADRVTLVHDWDLTLRTAEAFVSVLPPRALGVGVRLPDLLRGVGALRREHSGLHVGASDVAAIVRSGRLRGVRDAVGPGRLWDDEALSGFAMTFPARVTVHASGHTDTARVDVPRGGAGHREGPITVAAEKWEAWGQSLPPGLMAGGPT